MDLLPELAIWPEVTGTAAECYRGAQLILGWLETCPGSTWQERWDNRAEITDNANLFIDMFVSDPRDPRAETTIRAEIWGGLGLLFGCRAFIPSYRFLITFKAFT